MYYCIVKLRYIIVIKSYGEFILKKVVIAGIKLLISLGLLGYLFYSVPWNNLLELSGNVTAFFYGFCVVIVLLNQVLSAYRWQLFGLPLGLITSFKNYLIYFNTGNFMTLFLPGSLGGDVGRTINLAYITNQPKRLAGMALLFERLIGMVTLMLLIAAALPLVLPQIFQQNQQLIWGGIVSLVVSGALGPWLFKALNLNAVLEKIGIDSYIKNYQKRPWLIVGGIVLSVIAHVLMVVVHILIANDLGLSTSVLALIVVYGLVGLATALPISFNGIGVREGGYTLLLTAFNVPYEQALVFSLYWSSLYFLTCFVGGLPLLCGVPLLAKKTLTTESLGNPRGVNHDIN